MIQHRARLNMPGMVLCFPWRLEATTSAIGLCHVNIELQQMAGNLSLHETDDIERTDNNLS